MRFTGERLIPGIPRLENMIAEELARLHFVRSYFAGKTVLDAGCGVGYGAHFLAGNGAQWVLGIDISGEAISYAAGNYQRDNLVFCVMDCTRLGLADGSFDMVCSLDLIEHLTRPAQYLAEICRVLKPDGHYYMSTPNRKVSSTADGRASWAFHEREFSLDELHELLKTYFHKVEIWGVHVPVYEDHPIRKVTKSPLSQIKHVLPPRLRVWVSSSIRFWIKPDLHPDDVIFSSDDLEKTSAFVALCGRKRTQSCKEEIL